MQQKDYLILRGCAQGYILFGRSLSDMCDHNASVARKLAKTNVAMLWQFVKIMYTSSTSPMRPQSNDLASIQAHMMSGRLMNPTPKSSGWVDEQAAVNTANDHDTNDDEYQSADAAAAKHGDFKASGTGQAGALHAMSQTNRGIGAASAAAAAAASEATSDAFNNIVHGDTELTVEHMDYIKSFRNGFLYIGPHDLTKNFSLPSNSMMNHDMQQTARNQIVSKERRNTSPVSESEAESLNAAESAACAGLGRRCRCTQ